MDWLEELTTGSSDRIVVNSRFTADVFAKSFPTLATRGIKPSVLYPPVNVELFQGDVDPKTPSLPKVLQVKLQPTSSPKNIPQDIQNETIFLSINRFERKKGLGLAIEAFHKLIQTQQEGEQIVTSTRLVLAGGYDPNLLENIEHLAELKQLVDSLELTSHVTFITSFTNTQKLELLHRARCVLYTPENEHFGIVPIEAMCAERPVVAVASGGPLESVVHGESGFLCAPEPEAFAKAMAQLLENHKLALRMGVAGRKRALAHFSLATFADLLDDMVHDMLL